MDREIKFRGIYKGDYVYGNLIQGTGFDGEKLCQIENTDPSEFRKWDVDPKTVGQFTGIQDKNGNDVYEGDVVIWPHLDSEGKYEIYFEINELQYSARPLNDYNEIDSCLDSTHMEVISKSANQNPAVN